MTYELTDAVTAFIRTAYPSITGAESTDRDDANATFTAEQAVHVNAAFEWAGVVIPALRDLRGEPLRKLVIEANGYELTADNLRSALDREAGSFALDHIRQNSSVYRYCLTELSDYLTAVDDASGHQYAVESADELISVLADLAEMYVESAPVWAEPAFGALLARAAPGARLSSLRDAPEKAWPALAQARLFRASLANLEDYRAEVGSIDAALSALLDDAGIVEASEPDSVTSADGQQYDRAAAAIFILNVSEDLTPEKRVALAASLDPGVALPVSEIPAESNELFALLLEQGLVPDDEVTFERIRGGGWLAVRPAIAASDQIEGFLHPALVAGVVRDLLTSSAAKPKIARIVASEIDRYAPDGDQATVEAAARYAVDHDLVLTPERVAFVAQAIGSAGIPARRLVVRLLATAVPAANANEIVAVFMTLGGGYAQIGDSGASLRFPRDDEHDQLLEMLATAELVDRPRGRGSYPVKVR